MFFFFKQKTAYEMRISDWSSDVCSSDLKTDAEWKQQLGSQAYAVLRHAATERAFSSPLDDEHRAGLFACKGCGQHLYSSTTKFDSGTGWPSFWAPLPHAIGTSTDRKLLMARTEEIGRAHV